ncbi:uncharacterized protein [Spinacia oleracea]|uniref:Uncharacterized protein isoform X2 n=1 Tax=Spinacia oleracea TaxID=3562 RepID=A0ABM3QSE7_SPIOL|nr:uncharacterized protein LOC130459091 isoform X2 [Spinacia oleracea]
MARSKNKRAKTLHKSAGAQDDEDSRDDREKKKRKRASNLSADVKSPSSPIVTRCRPCTLEKVVSGLTQLQQLDVVEVGFGGLLGLQMKRMVRSILPWLVNSFNGVSCMFSISKGKEFVVTKFDVHDVFCLPMGGGVEIPELKVNRLCPQEDEALKAEWRRRFDVPDNQGISLCKLEARMKQLADGGDEFKRCFVIHALSSLLVPTSNRTVNLKLLKAVEDVNRIRKYDWCSYVLKRLKKVVVEYKKMTTQKHVSGCLLLLQILYFHRLKFQGHVENSGLPLIQHWTDLKVKERISLELKAGGFGKGLLDKVTYPVSDMLHLNQEAQVETCDEDEANDGPPSNNADEGETDIATGGPSPNPTARVLESGIPIPQWWWCFQCECWSPWRCWYRKVRSF